jgi:2-methylisocitrate lyase-like PEP mutase family enzyme
LVPTTYPSLTEAQVRELGRVKLLIYANHPLRAAVKGIQAALEEIKRTGGIHSVEEQLVPVREIFALQGVPEMKSREKQYLPQMEMKP